MIKRRHLLGAGAAVLAGAAGLSLLPPSGRAGQPEVFQGTNGMFAIGGYDPVAYFTEGKPVVGDPTILTDWRGATWRFASEANRDAFIADPVKYAPAYGGYCAYAVAQGYTAKTEPEAWHIHEGRLYLNYSLGIRRRWARDIPGNVDKGDANWPNVLN